MIILIADSGSTKSDWLAIDENGQVLAQFNTMGFNPYFHSSDKVEAELKAKPEMMEIAEKIDKTYFYGAGSSSVEMCDIIKEGLSRVLVNSEIHVGHDLDGAAYSTWSGEPSITCILGTGSNSCFFDGEKTHEEVPSLAYILGDEGSGSWFGKRLLQGFFYKQLPQHIHDDFISEFGLEETHVNYVNKRVYKGDGPNVYLASFTRFIGKHKNDPLIRQWLLDGFHAFLSVHVECFSNFKDVPVHFIGSIAYHFKEELIEACEERGMRVGNMIQAPIDGLADYHLTYKVN
jgi:N-acetylglucosamine kinase-like BadF-type ATPase